jgi:hypothetical protein
MKPLSFLVAIACSLLLIGCTNTEGTLDIAGKVSDEYTNEDIPHRGVIIQNMIMSDSQLIPGDDIGRFTTDSTGHFAYTMKKTRNVYWYNFVFAGDSSYTYSDKAVCITELERNPKLLSFYLDKLTDFTIKIERISKTTPYDTLFISWKTNDIDGRIYPHSVINYGTIPDLEYRWIGKNIKSQIETKTFANKNTIVHMDLYGDGMVKELSDTIYCNRDVVNYFTFKY